MISKSNTPENNLRIELKSHTEGKSSKIEVRSFTNTDFEMLFLATDIQTRIDEGVLPEEIAVIYRNNKDADRIAHVLEKTKIPFSVESDQNILKDVDIQSIKLAL